jgi:hypothetical protein
VNPEPTWSLYAALAAEAGVNAAVSVDDPRVLTEVLVHDDGRRFAWFVSETVEPLRVVPETAGTLHDRVTGEVLAEVELDPFGVVVVEVR